LTMASLAMAAALAQPAVASTLRSSRALAQGLKLFRASPSASVPLRRVYSVHRYRTRALRGGESGARGPSTGVTGVIGVKAKDIALDPFAQRQFVKDSGSSTIIEFDQEEFINKVNQYYEQGNKELVDGYAPFCKHIFIPNFTPASTVAVEITPDNEHMLVSAYKARTEKELPVLTRWFPKEKMGELPRAKYLDIILYSREQIKKEREAMGDDPDFQESSPWGIVSIKPTDFDYETPMQPITMMRNALGRDQGGSGVPMEREKYTAAVDFWSKYAPVQ